MTPRRYRYRWITHEGASLADVGVHADGTLHNPNGYPDALVRAAVAAAEARGHERRVRGAKKAVETRQRRHRLRVDALARKLVAGGTTGPAVHCAICAKPLDDAESVRRGIGSECWQQILTALEQIQADDVAVT